MDRTAGLLFLICLVVKILVVEGFEQAEEVDLEARFVTTTSESTTTAASAAEAVTVATKPYFQPALIGFRCEGGSEQTLDGISVIEANAPVKITLFGEAFTTNTIVAFTTELVRDPDIVDEVISSNQINSQVTPAGRLQFESSLAISSPPPEAQTIYSKVDTPNSTGSIGAERSGLLARAANQPQQRKSKKFERRLLSRNYDCTDYDRIISYKLNEDNIITPNVAVLTIRLPELDQSSSGPYYYFCLKQPPIPSSQLPEIHHESLSARAFSEQPGIHDKHFVNGPLVLGPEQFNGSLSNQSNGNQQQQLVWVHQGDEWWLALKVEPPILSVANDCILIVLLLFLSAVTSGLNLGLMSLDMNELAVISSCGDQRERSYARTIAPLRKRGNYLLCSLLLGNVMVNSTLTVILEEMTSGVVAVIGSTLAIVVLGEIVPQAFCARQGLAIGAKTIYLTYAFMIITFPLSYPISCLLDCVLGEERGNVYDRERLMEFIRITGNHTQLEADEVAIISGALKLKKIRVDQIMSRIEDVFMLPIDCMLNRDTIKSIIEKGYSRIPVYEFGDRKQIVALILAKDLALLDPDDQVPLANMLMYCKHPLIFIEDTATLDVALNEFKTGKSHMAIVRQIYDDGEVDKYYEAIGVVTLEDVIEEVLQTEINDETDTLSDNRRKRRRMDAQVAHLVDNLAQQQPALPGPTPAAPKF